MNKKIVFHVALFEPEIPPNTGNIIRLCANTGSHLHLIKPYGFELDDKKLRRAGLDYHEFVGVREYKGLAELLEQLKPERIFAFTTKGRQRYDQVDFRPGDLFLFGPESQGLPLEVLESLPEEQRLRIPMQEGQRSLNLANAASIVLYEAWRQQDFSGI